MVLRERVLLVCQSNQDRDHSPIVPKAEYRIWFEHHFLGLASRVSYISIKISRINSLFSKSINHQFYQSTYIGKLNIDRITSDGTILVFVSGIGNQLLIPYPKVMFTISSLWKHCNCRSAKIFTYYYRSNVRIIYIFKNISFCF